MNSSRVRVDDINESRLQASTANKEAVNVGLLRELAAVLLRHATSIKNASLLRSLRGYLLLQPLTDRSMDLLCLLSGSDLAGANGPMQWLVDGESFGRPGPCSPDRLVGDDDLRPVLDLVCDSLELGCNDLDGLACLALLQALTAAQNNAETAINGSLGLACNESIVFLEDDSPLGVADEGPCDAALLQLLSGDLAGESAIGLVEDVLGSDFDALAEVLACKE